VRAARRERRCHRSIRPASLEFAGDGKRSRPDRSSSPLASSVGQINAKCCTPVQSGTYRGTESTDTDCALPAPYSAEAARDRNRAARSAPQRRQRQRRPTDLQFDRTRIIIRLCLQTISASVTRTAVPCFASDWPRMRLGESSCFPTRGKWVRPHFFWSSRKNARIPRSMRPGTPEAALPGFWERLWSQAERVALTGRAIVLLDEAHLLYDWAARLRASGIGSGGPHKRAPNVCFSRATGAIVDQLGRLTIPTGSG
jgi:hypothetical protein